MPAQTENRIKGFKNNKKDIDEGRKKRNDVTVELRKNRKYDQILKKRNVSSMSLSPLKENNQQTPLPLLSQEEIIQILLNKDGNTNEQILQAVQSTRRLLSREKNPPIDRVIKAGLVPELVRLLGCENTNIQFEAAWAVTNIASGNSDQTRTVVESGAVDHFVTLLSSGHVQVCEQAVWALGNIAGDGPAFRDYVISRGVVQPLLGLIKQNTPYPFLRNVTWTLSNLCRNKNPPPKIEEIEHALPALAYLIKHADKEVNADACWALSYLTDGPNEKIGVIISTGVVPRLVELLSDTNVNIVTPALRAIGNIVTGDDVQTQAVIGEGALPRLKLLFDHPKSQIIKEAAWAVSNIAAGNTEQIQAIIDADLLEPVVNALDKAEFKVQKEAVWVITNFTSGGSVEQIITLIKHNVLGPLCRMLSTHDSKTTMVALDAVNNILLNADRMSPVDIAKLMKECGIQNMDRMSGVDIITLQIEECGGLDPIEKLQTHENDSIQKSAYDIIDQYFQADSDQEEETVAPVASDSQYVFGAAGPSNAQFNF